MQGSCRNLLVALALTTVGVAAFFLFLYLTGHDPDDSPLTLKEWMIAGVLIGPGFGYLIKWRRARKSWLSRSAKQAIDVEFVPAS